MSGISTAPRVWCRVSRHHPCPICGKIDWCTYSAGGNTVGCMRVQSPRRLKNGGWLHYLSGNTVTQLPPIALTKPAACLAPLMQRDLVYRAFIAELGLRPHHKEHLERVRGLPNCALTDFASTPPSAHAECRKLVGRVIDRLGKSDILRGVPGFLVDKYGNWTCQWVPPGIVIPIREPLFGVQALQVRLDSCGPETGRHRWFSSRGKPGGSSPGVPAAFWWPPRLDYDPVLVTEGPLKARIASKGGGSGASS